jgi:FAD/FMN-containing dehydrogenase
MGWLTRMAGLTCDNLISVELITADSEIVHASAGENSDLFWALRGGGGNFGVVTRFEFQLHEVGPQVHLGFFFWPLESGLEVLRFVAELVDTLPWNTGVWVGGLSAPPAPFVPEQYHWMNGYAVLIAGFGSPEAHAGVVAPVQDLNRPLFQLVTSLPYTELQKLFDDGLPWGTLAYEKALYVDNLSDEVITVFSRSMPHKTSRLSIVPVFHLGGKYASTPDEETAFGGPRRNTWAFNITANCSTSEELRADRVWVRTFWDALVPHAAGSGSYVNFMSDLEEDRVRASYGAAKYERLAHIKARYDPNNLFRLNANIKPACHPLNTRARSGLSA